jgi:hypothetical protein
MERRRFIATAGLVVPWWKTLFLNEPARAKPLLSHTTVPVAAAGSAFVTILSQLLPLATTVVNKLFGPAAKDSKSVTKGQVTASVDQLANDLQTQAGSVNNDVKFLTAWRKTAASFDGSVAIKDSLIQIGMLVDSVERFSEPGLTATKADVKRMVEEATARIQKIVNSGSLEELPEVDTLNARSAANTVANKLAFIAKRVGSIQNVTEPASIRQVFSEVGPVVQDGIDGCERITLGHEEYQIRLSNDFLEYMKKFGAQPNKDISDKAQSKTDKTLGNERVPIEQAPGVLERLATTLTLK